MENVKRCNHLASTILQETLCSKGCPRNFCRKALHGQRDPPMGRGSVLRNVDNQIPAVSSRRAYPMSALAKESALSFGSRFHLS